MIPPNISIDDIVSDLSDSDVYIEEGLDLDEIDPSVPLRTTEETGPTKVLYFNSYHRPADLRDIAQAVLNRTDTDMVIARVWQHGTAVSTKLSRINIESNDDIMMETLSQTAVNDYLTAVSNHDDHLALINGAALSTVILTAVSTLAALKKWGMRRSR